MLTKPELPLKWLDLSRLLRGSRGQLGVRVGAVEAVYFYGEVVKQDSFVGSASPGVGRNSHILCGPLPAIIKSHAHESREQTQRDSQRVPFVAADHIDGLPNEMLYYHRPCFGIKVRVHRGWIQYLNEFGRVLQYAGGSGSPTPYTLQLFE
jgi:hypothetical protein